MVGAEHPPAASAKATLRLRPLRLSDEDAFAAAQRAMVADRFVFGLWYQPDTRWPDYLALLERQRRGVDLPSDQVPATFLVADVDGVIVGRTSIRHLLNDYLELVGGHIGYGVLADHRRQGYAAAILSQSLVIARAAGVERVLITCDDGNVGSQTVIERCGGLLERVVADPDDGHSVRRYWID